MTTHKTAAGFRRALAAVTAAGLLTVGLASCGGDDDSSDAAAGRHGSGSSAEGVDDGAKLTLWTRAPLEFQAKAAGRGLQQDATRTRSSSPSPPTTTTSPRSVRRRAAATCPTCSPRTSSTSPTGPRQGLFADISERIDQLPYEDEINQGHLDAGTYEDKEYVLPFVLDLSVMFYNKDLYKEAGLDPEKGPTTLEEFKDHALAIQKLDKPDTYGTYFGGNCGGCNVFTWFPMMWASGEEVMNEDGTEANLASDAAKQVYGTWNELNKAGAIAPGAKDETGATWVAAFQEGKVGVMPYPATLLRHGRQDRRRRSRPDPRSRRRCVNLRRRRRHRHLEGLRQGRPGLELPVLADVRGRPGRGARCQQQQPLQVGPRGQQVRGQGPARRRHQRGRRSRGQQDPGRRRTSSRPSTHPAARG